MEFGEWIHFQSRRCKRWGFDPWLRNTWSRKWQPIPACLLGKFHGQRSLVGVHGGSKELDMTEYNNILALHKLESSLFLPRVCLLVHSSMGPQENASQTVNCIKKDYKQQSIQSFFFQSSTYYSILSIYLSFPLYHCKICNLRVLVLIRKRHQRISQRNST